MLDFIYKVIIEIESKSPLDKLFSLFLAISLILLPIALTVFIVKTLAGGCY